MMMRVMAKDQDENHAHNQDEEMWMRVAAKAVELASKFITERKGYG